MLFRFAFIFYFIRIVINVESQKSKTHWVAGGEASLWTYKSINDFSNFIFRMYDPRHIQVCDL